MSVRAAAALLVVVALGELVMRPMVSKIVISKSRRSLTAYDGSERVLHEFAVGLGSNLEGSKRHEGDSRTPEGEYFICFKNPKSRFHLSLGLSYPNPADAERGLAEGAISSEEFRAIVEAERLRRQPPWKTALGGEIFIHGGLDTTPTTAGCIALADSAIEALFPLVPLGTPVSIVP